MRTGEQRAADVLRQPSRDKSDGIGGADRRLIEQHFAHRIDFRPPRHEIDDAAHCAGTVERRRDPLDHFDLTEVHRRDLQQPETADLLAGQRHAVEQHPRVAALHALDADAGGAERGRCRLHAHAAHLVQHHHDVAGRHQHLLFDFLAVEDLDADRLIVDAAAGAGGGDDDRLFHFDRRRRRRRRLLLGGLALEVDGAADQGEHDHRASGDHCLINRWNSGSARSFSNDGSFAASSFHCLGCRAIAIDSCSIAAALLPAAA